MPWRLHYFSGLPELPKFGTRNCRDSELDSAHGSTEKALKDPELPGLPELVNNVCGKAYGLGTGAVDPGGAGCGPDAPPRVDSVGTIQAVKKSAGANKAACATQFIVFMAVFAADTLSSRRTDAFPHGGMLATAAFAWRENVVLVQLGRQGRVAAGAVEAGQAACFAGNECGACASFHPALSSSPAAPRSTGLYLRRVVRLPERTQVNACAHRGLAGWGLASADGPAVWFKRRRSALAAGMGSQVGFSASLRGDFRAHRRFPFWTSLAAPRSTGRELCIKTSGLGRLRAQGAGQQGFGSGRGMILDSCGDVPSGLAPALLAQRFFLVIPVYIESGGAAIAGCGVGDREGADGLADAGGDPPEADGRAVRGWARGGRRGGGRCFPAMALFSLCSLRLVAGFVDRVVRQRGWPGEVSVLRASFFPAQLAGFATRVSNRGNEEEGEENEFVEVLD